MSNVEKASSIHAPAAFAGLLLYLFGWCFFVFDPESFQESAHALTNGLAAGLCRAGIVENQASAPRRRKIIAKRSVSKKCLHSSTS
jgi:hypothetical protein